MIYLDHAATSWPKPPQVLQAMQHFLMEAGGNPGRSGHRVSIEAGRIIYEARESLARLFSITDPLRIILQANATAALNLALYGMLKPGDHVVTTAIEHNAVMRPLRDLQSRGVHVTVARCDKSGKLDLEAFADALGRKTRLVVLNHASNVSGIITPVQEAASLAHQAGALVLLDAAQSAGCVPFSMADTGADLLAFTGHKALCGPPGTGGLVIGESFDPSLLQTLVRGGTGSRSEYEVQPEFLPDKYESGTPNGVGIAGLGAGVRWLLERGIASIRTHELHLTRELLTGLETVPGVQVYGPYAVEERTATISLTLAGRQVSDIGWHLDEEFGIMCRVGLHCSPAAHRTLGTFPEGTVRLALGWSNTQDDVAAVIDALRSISLS